MAFADVPINSQNYRRAIVKDCPEYFTAVLSDPVKVSGAWHYGAHVSRDTTSAVYSHRSIASSSSSSSSSSQRYTRSLARPGGFYILRKWEDCLELQQILRTELAALEKARKKRGNKEPPRLYPSNRAASFESLPCADGHNALLGPDAIPKLSRKSSLFKASQAMIAKRQTEFGALIAWLFGVEHALAEDLRHAKPVREWFSYWRSDKECEGKVRPPTAPLQQSSTSSSPTFLAGRGRQESMSSMRTSTTTSGGSSYMPLSPEVRVSTSFNPLLSHLKAPPPGRPMSVLTDISAFSDGYHDELMQTMDSFPTPPPLEEDELRVLSPTQSSNSSPTFLGRIGRQESVSSLATSTTASEGSSYAPLPSEVHVSPSFSPSAPLVESVETERPVSVLTDVSEFSGDYHDRLMQTIDDLMQTMDTSPTLPQSTNSSPTLFGGRGRQESVSSMTTSTTMSDDEGSFALSSPQLRVVPSSPELRVSHYNPSMSYLKAATTGRPVSVLTDISVLSDDYYDELMQTVDSFPTPPPLKDDALRSLPPTLRRRAASCDQLSRLGMMTPVPPAPQQLSTPIPRSPVPPSTLQPSPIILPEEQPHPSRSRSSRRERLSTLSFSSRSGGRQEKASEVVPIRFIRPRTAGADGKSVSYLIM